MTDLPHYSPQMGTHAQRIVERLEGRVRELEASAAKDEEIIERLRGGLEAVLREHTTDSWAGRDYCRLCSPKDPRWPCVTVLEVREALTGMV